MLPADPVIDAVSKLSSICPAVPTANAHLVFRITVQAERPTKRPAGEAGLKQSEEMVCCNYITLYCTAEAVSIKVNAV
jgi:hypothetical protein